MAKLNDMHSYVELSSDIEWEPYSIHFERTEDAVAEPNKRKTSKVGQGDMVVTEQ
jgi:hypothetical protein